MYGCGCMYRWCFFRHMYGCTCMGVGVKVGVDVWVWVYVLEVFLKHLCG